MIEYIEIEQRGFKFNVPKRDNISEWNEWIAIWLNENCTPEQVQRTIDGHIGNDSIKYREKNFKNLLDDLLK